jgi:hypothetical protein
MNAVFKKELRDCLRWAPLGMVLGLVMLWMVRPTGVYEATSMESQLMSQLGLAASLIAISLGLLQSLFDTRTDSRGYLLHRPTPTQEIFWGKVAAGYITYMITLAAPVLIAMIYLQFNGIEQLPTNAWQLVPFFLYSFVVFLLHPTVLWISNRDANWIGTRLLPAGGAIAIVLFMMTWLGHPPFQNPIDSIVLGLAIFAIFASVTLIASRHAFVHQSQLPPRSSVHWRSVVGMMGLVFSGVILYGVAFAFLYQSIPRTPGDYIDYELLMNDRGTWEQVQTKRPGGNWNVLEISTRNLNGQGEFTPVDKSWKMAHNSMLNPITNGLNSSIQQFTYLGSAQSDKVKYGQVVLVEHQDQLLLYGENRNFVGIVTPEGSFEDISQAKGNFDRLVNVHSLHQSGLLWLTSTSNPLLADDNGVYQLDGNALRVHKLLDEKVDRIMLLMEANETPASLWTVSGNKLTRHEIASTNPDSPMPQADSLTVETTQRFSLPMFKVLSSQSYALDPLGEHDSLRVLRTPEGQYAMIRTTFDTNESAYARLTPNGDTEAIGSVQLPEAQRAISEDWAGWTIPPGVAATLIGIMILIVGKVGVGTPTGFALSILGHAVLAALATWWLGGRLDLSRRERTIWTVVGGLIGFGTLIGLVSIYRKPIKETCPRCSKLRRIDLESCEHCSQPWDAPAEEGVEIFERDLSPDTLSAPSLN